MDTSTETVNVSAVELLVVNGSAVELLITDCFIACQLMFNCLLCRPRLLQLFDSSAAVPQTFGSSSSSGCKVRDQTAVLCLVQGIHGS